MELIKIWFRSTQGSALTNFADTRNLIRLRRKTYFFTTNQFGKDKEAVK